MTYGKRLNQAMEARGVARRELATAIGCTPQILGIVINSSEEKDRKLNTENHAAAVMRLSVSSDWLLHGRGTMEPTEPQATSKEATPGAMEIAILYDLIPVGDRIKRAQAWNAATRAILDVLQSEPASAQPNPHQKKQRV